MGHAKVCISCGDHRHGPERAWHVRTRDAMGHSSLSLERARFTGGSSATSCEDLMRAVLMFIGRWRLRPLAAAAACCALRWSSSTVCLVHHCAIGTFSGQPY